MSKSDWLTHPRPRSDWPRWPRSLHQLIYSRIGISKIRPMMQLNSFKRFLQTRCSALVATPILVLLSNSAVKFRISNTPVSDMSRSFLVNIRIVQKRRNMGNWNKTIWNLHFDSFLDWTQNGGPKIRFKNQNIQAPWKFNKSTWYIRVRDSSFEKINHYLSYSESLDGVIQLFFYFLNSYFMTQNLWFIVKSIIPVQFQILILNSH